MSQKQEMYYAIHCTEDGIHLASFTKDQLETELDDDYFGKDPEFIQPGDPMPNLEYNRRVLLIKGKVVVPKIVEVVTKRELP